MKNVLITGGSGFLGEQLVNRLYMRVKITVLARDEGKLLDLKFKYPDINIITGDVADEYTAQQACNDMDTCFHLAAFKHVGIAQVQPYECYRSNVEGTANLLKHFKGQYFLMTSTDKAAQVTGVYGASKYIAEQLIHEHAKKQTRTKYRVVRYGNVLYSTGSVLVKWKKLIQAGEPVTITDPNATRYFWTVDQAIDLIFKCGQWATDSNPYCPEMKSMGMGDLLDAMIKKYDQRRWAALSDKFPPYTINTTGLQPGENKHEKITEDGISSEHADKWTIEEIMELI
jgi:UDP-N-acetylglucosamine 4,6-dehydratase/5-epimerase